MSDNFVYSHRNGEMTPPVLGEREWSWYWFDGIASYEDWHQRGSLVVVTGKHTDRVVGLVLVAMLPNMKHPTIDERGWLVNDHPTMIAIPETNGYDLDKCEGRWWGPVHVPKLSDDTLLCAADVRDYDEWKQSHGDAKPWEDNHE